MKWRMSKGNLILLVICIINIVAHICVYSYLPEVIPIHWGINNQVDGYGPKYIDLLLSFLPLGLFLLMLIIPKIDPKHQNYEKFQGVWSGFKYGISIFLIMITWMAELVIFQIIQDGSDVIGILIFGGLGIGSILFGIYMPRIRQNYTFGIRTPWALADEENWNRTHRMGGLVFIVIGVMMLIVALPIWPHTITVILVLTIVIGSTLWLYVYSYLVYRGILK